MAPGPSLSEWSRLVQRARASRFSLTLCVAPSVGCPARPARAYCPGEKSATPAPWDGCSEHEGLPAVINDAILGWWEAR